MKTKFSFIISLCISILVFPSCESHEKKVDDAFETVKEEKKLLQDSDSVANLTIKDEKKIDPAKITEKPDEWTCFKNEIEKKIVLNEKKIKEIKGTPNTNSKLLVKVSHLEQDNNNLRTQMEEYKKEEKIRWDKFQSKLKEQANDINAELKQVSPSEKKIN